MVLSFLAQKTKLLAKIWRKNKPSRTFKILEERLEKQRVVLTEEFSSKHKDTLSWLAEKGIDVDQVWHRGTRGVLASVAAGLILISNSSLPTKNLVPETEASSQANKITASVGTREVVDEKLVQALSFQLPDHNRPLTAEEEVKITQTISELTGVKVVAELDGNKLNTNYGRMGLEQHLPRYPGENIAEHFTSSAGFATYAKGGLTKNKGAFGYFASSKYTLSQEAIEEEKYYVVVQTFLSKNWGKDKVNWYKHRKVLVVNPTNGHVVVGDIADSGPAPSTGKNFGGSPEFMDSLGMYTGNSKISVLLFFIDDAGGGVPSLGPL